MSVFRLAENIQDNFSTIQAHIIEKDRDRAKEIAHILRNHTVLCGDCLDADLLREAGIDQVETVVAVTQDDRVNMLASVLAKNLGAKRTLALVSNPSYGSLINSMSVDAVINPRALTVSKILQYVYKGRLRSISSLSSALGEVVEAETIETSGFIGKTIAEINEPRHIKVVALVRFEKPLIPNDNMRVESGDRIILMVSPKAMTTIEKLFSHHIDYHL